MMARRLLLVLLVMIGSFPAEAEQVTSLELFGVPAAEVSEVFGEARANRLRCAVDDFNRVLAGRYPTHAKFDPVGSRAAGSPVKSIYNGDGYSVAIHHEVAIASAGENKTVVGVIYGPELRFTKELFETEGPGARIVRTRFYTVEQLKEIQRRSQKEINEQKALFERARETIRSR